MQPQKTNQQLIANITENYRQGLHEYTEIKNRLDIKFKKEEVESRLNELTFQLHELESIMKDSNKKLPSNNPNNHEKYIVGLKNQSDDALKILQMLCDNFTD